MPTLVTVRETVCVPANDPMAIEAELKSLGSVRNPSAASFAQVLGPTAEVLPQRKASHWFQPLSKTKPGSVALLGVTWPAPWLKMTVALVFGPSRTSPAVVMNADLIAMGDHEGLACLSNAARPAMCGADMEVPL
ncbi:MAG: hypothetical protein BWY91_02853 [bacterium ADurb.BinA028]|nr:MAG: hypothetical protein BWY91_02853 [bacterium ADurb.BinA028]